MPAGATFFAPDTRRPVHTLLGRKCSAGLSREVADFEEISHQLPGGTTELIFWPRAMRPAADKSETDAQAHVKRAQRTARSAGAFVVQANWPNSVKDREASVCSGQSVVIDPAGEVVTRLSVAEAGVAGFRLGESNHV